MTSPAIPPARWFLATILLVYAASTVTYYVLGVRFDASPYPNFMQFIDRDLLADRFVESIWFYHAFPPLLNVFVGIGEKLFGNHAGIFFNITFHLAGLLLALSIGAITAHLTGSRWVAVTAVAVLVFSPGFVLYENWLMYSFPATAMLTVSVFALQKFLDTRRPSWGFAFFSLLSVLTLTRSLFHLGWLVLVAVALSALLRGQRRMVLLAAALPIAVAASWYGKNYYLFGTFSASNLGGFGLANITTLTVPSDELLPHVRDGVLSPYALVSRYTDLEQIFSTQRIELTGVPVLDRVWRPAGGYNFNNIRIVAANRHYLEDGVRTVRLFPYYYSTGLRISNLLFFSPTHMNFYFSADNRKAAWPMERLFNPLLYGVPPGFGHIMQPHWGYDPNHVLEANPSVPLMALWVVVLCAGYWTARTAVLSENETNKTRGVLIAFIVANAIYVYCMGTMFELGENYRYRFLIEPLFFVLTAVVLTDVVRWVMRRRSIDTR